MKSLKTVEDMVNAVLKKDEDARNDDMLLYLKVCDTCVKGAGAMPFATIMAGYKLYGLPHFESVRRTRQKLQAQNPQLLGSVGTKRLRVVQERIYRQYARE